ncbi:MAG: cysteine biosynthesis protein CysZ, partial [Rhizobiales bacterium]|nr:cysteine biosynthesis protein CysZ [Hyphomicrobiales bacterium]
MILDAARLSLANLFAPETRGVFWKVLGLTVLALIVVWFGLRESFVAFVWPWLQGAVMPDLPQWAGWLTFVFGIAASLGLALGLVLLLAPVTAVIAGFFLDDVAEVIEKRDY